MSRLSQAKRWAKDFFQVTPPPPVPVAKAPAPDPVPVLPQTKAELVQWLKSLPEPVLSVHERRSISAVMSFEHKLVSKVMTPKSELTFVGANDYLGPLTLDKLHKTGHIHFLVRGTAGKVVGALHIRDLLNLKIKESDKAKNYLDKNLCYVRSDYSLEQALATFLRTGSLMAVVVDRDARMVGVLLLEDLVVFLLGREAVDDFEDDYNIDAVAARG
jgi:CBS domain containing-hemolysin-like protein